MNRVVLCGRLAERPRISASSSGIPVALLRLQVPRQGVSQPPQRVDEIDCLAFEELAQRLFLHAEAGVWVNLEGFLLPGAFIGREGREEFGYRVAVEAAYWLDPRETAPVMTTAEPPSDPEPETAHPERAAALGKTLYDLLSGVRSALARGSLFVSGNGGPALGNGKAGV